ncbi:MAG TPA: WYL domain-containing protein [Amaricoccus sp.]|nr:WYL domain-containing protein [Amaricoccus sp.]
MSLAKARDLMRLAEMAAARHSGVSLAEIAAEFGADHRTAQRMVRALEDTFQGVEIRTDEDRRRRWKLRDPGLARFQGIRDDELAALEMSIRRAEREGAALDVTALSAVRDRLLACMPGLQARRAEADAEALLEARGFAARPGPRVRAEPGVLETIAEALKAPFLLAITYAGPDGAVAERRVAPHGLLLGPRRYLVARDEDRDAGLRHFRVDRIRAARLLGSSFTRAPGFDIEDHAARAFGSYQDEATYGEVVWRFSPAAAPTARDFLFHPAQRLEDEPDGSLVVRFHASGWLEMAWHLYQWGDTVEVLAPEGLRALTEGHRRSDFEALP